MTTTKDIEFFNVGELESIPGLGEQCLTRIPQAVRCLLNQGARTTGVDSVGCELRMVSDAPIIDVYLKALSPNSGNVGEVRVFRGDFLHQTHRVEPGRTTLIRLNQPESFARVNPGQLNQGGFSERVWRLAMNNGSRFAFHHVDAFGWPLRPPLAEEKPKLNWLAYGSSITHSCLDGYPHLAARMLKAQVQNKGLSGSCHLEPALIDWLAEECEWDAATLEMGINMRGCFEPEDFEERAGYAIQRFAATGRPVLAINLFPNSCTPGLTRDETARECRRELAFNRIVERLAQDCHCDNLHFMPGSAILDDFTGLSSDLLHPCAYGHAVMAVNLARELKRIMGYSVHASRDHQSFPEDT